MRGNRDPGGEHGEERIAEQAARHQAVQTAKYGHHLLADGTLLGQEAALIQDGEH